MLTSLPLYARLPLVFEVEAMRAAMQAIPADHWQAHFNSGYYEGDWSGVALIAPADAPSALAPGAGQAAGVATPLYDAFWQGLLGRLDLDLRSARLLRLGPGSRIREHCDPDLGMPGSDMRLHIPIVSPVGVEFLLDNRRIPMQPGECWFLDLSRPHRVENRADEARVHLVLDCRPSRWLYQIIETGLASTPEAAASHGTELFQAFRRLVHDDAQLTAKLADITDAGDFTAAVVALAGVYGLVLAPDDVQSAMRQGRRDWIEQWMA
ncbi:aspartyl/asparaginyl beta-hydroxylase domain-containing protein [Chitinimonas arctica]|uniref:Aspartyl/asparaginyl beta-hydroxylase domain-containing protein n=1 Tax=Chitinimonas arctica TaxID=2594795 RepID=A0A516SKW5_9NEIS|nr:aspartyl/asparaginyl beta-hydroxylase domain-containing protein [Chitinimonas arctica]QDQ28796.1 aspartyl/asparaginyl beta-hydroxylase domain-containing protein [Chitinimonas arctica]